MTFHQSSGCSPLSADAMSKAMRAELSRELGLALASIIDSTSPPERHLHTQAILAEFYAMCRRNGGLAAMTDEDRHRLFEQGWSEKAIKTLSNLVRSHGGLSVIGQGALDTMLAECGADRTDSNRRVLSRVLLAAREQAQLRAGRYLDPAVQALPDPVGFLLGADALSSGSVAAPPLPASTKMAPAGQTVAGGAGAVKPSSELDRFLREMRAGTWAPATEMGGRRAVEFFIWVAGDKPFDQLGQGDVARFRSALLSLGTKFSLKKYRDQPAGQVIEAQTGHSGEQRSNKTINRDLSYLSTWIEWTEAQGYLVKGQLATKDLFLPVSKKDKANKRPKWTVDQLHHLLRAPIFTGCAGPRRGRHQPGSLTYHDAAYWVPLLILCSGLRREEACGLACTDVVFEAEVAYFDIRFTRYRRLKNEASTRLIPIHPDLVRLGLRDYVEALRAEGSDLLFPELAGSETLTFGDRYYDLAWTKLVRERFPIGDIPRAENGKGADIHSIRHSMASLLERPTINRTIVKDLLGHAREGVTEEIYSDGSTVYADATYLRDRLEVLMMLPRFAEHLEPAPIRLLPRHLRSR